YKEWLKIEAPNRPLNYYQLLKFNRFEDDPTVIRNRYRELNAYVRKFATGDFIEESQALLNELAKAMLCLTDAERKAEYDFSLGRKQAAAETSTSGRRTFEGIVVEEKLATPEQLKKAKNLSDAVGLPLHQALLQQKTAEPERIMMAYAESEGLPFVNLEDVPVDEYYAPQIEPATARQHSFVPVMADMGKLILASPEPLSLDVEDELRLIFDMPTRCAICTPQQVNAAIEKYYPRGAVRQVVERAADGSTAKQDAKPKAAPKQKAAKETVELSKAAQKNRLKLTIVCFNFGVMLGTVGSTLAMKAGMGKAIGIGVAVGAIAATIAWFCAPKEVEE
ncbi:MAG: hypothetical protein IJ387_03445, partial [Thermoguttaceae bacterium]|nr:hypothetical protein [Thermoguttaceae bacterium]